MAENLAGATPPRVLPDSVQWLEGMLLAPQHLQQNDLYWAEHLRYRIEQVAPNYWGLRALTLDAVKFKAGIVSVRRLECVMPDGTPVLYPGNYGNGLELDVNTALKATPLGVRISLVMPVREAASNRMDDAPRRNDVVHGALAADVNSGAAMVAVDRLRPCIALSAEAAASPWYVVCPLFEIERREDSRNIEFKPYHPPLLHWQACEFLGGASFWQRLQTLDQALWQKLRELAGNRRDDGPNEDELQGSDLRRHTEAARRLAAVLPQFSLLVQRAEATPLAVYDSLAQLVGAMSAFGANPIPPVLDAYRHEDCEPQFRRAIDYVAGKLRYVNTSFEYLVFEYLGKGRFRRSLPPDAGTELVIELRLQDGQAMGPADRAALDRWLQDACIASQDLIDIALRSRLSARVRMLQPDEITQRNLRAGAALFVIENSRFEVDVRGAVPLFEAGQPLLIEGNPQSPGAQPASILLYQPRRGTGSA